MKTIVKNIRALYRFSAMAIMSFGVYSLWILGTFFVSDKIRWRQTIFTKWAKYAVKITKMKIGVRGKVPESPFFLVSNHLSYMDIPAFRHILTASFIAKSEVANWFFVGKFVGGMGTVFVNRNNRRDILTSGEKVFEKIESGESLIFFPEGTSSDGKTVLPFKSSFLEFAAIKNLPVSYASVSYRIPNGEESAGDAICWWGDAEFISHFWRLCRIKTFTAILNFGEKPIRNQNRKLLTKELHEKISENFEPVL